MHIKNAPLPIGIEYYFLLYHKIPGMRIGEIVRDKNTFRGKQSAAAPLGKEKRQSGKEKDTAAGDAFFPGENSVPKWHPGEDSNLRSFA